MIAIEIPGQGTLSLSHAVFDLNGTLAEDGRIDEEIMGLVEQISARLNVVVATADTFGTAAALFNPRKIAWHQVSSGEDKERLVHRANGTVVAVGNGANDAAMFRSADLAICILGPEGASTAALMAADIVVPSILVGLGLLLHPKRLVATLRG